MLQNARFTVFTFSKLLTENQQGGGGGGENYLSPKSRLGFIQFIFIKVFWYKVET